jgi:GT2 family glycosyltransferase
MQPEVWCVVPCFNRSKETLRFLKHFFEQDYKNKHVVIVDDDCTDNTGINVELNYPDAHVVYGEGDLWWAGGTNLAIKYALEHGADYVMTINDDSQFDSDLISKLVNIAVQDKKYIVGSVLVEEHNEDIIWSVGSRHDFDEQRLMALNHSGDKLDMLTSLPNPFPVEMMPGNGVLIPREVIEAVGYYDEINMPQYHADSELIKRASLAGFKPVICLDTVIINQILTEPLVNNVKDLIFFKKSDMYWRALATMLLRYFPNVDLSKSFNQLYREFL